MPFLMLMRGLKVIFWVSSDLLSSCILCFLVSLCFTDLMFFTVADAKKEMQKQLGVSVENIGLYKPSNNERRRRRPGILGYI